MPFRLTLLGKPAECVAVLLRRLRGEGEALFDDRIVRTEQNALFGLDREDPVVGREMLAVGHVFGERRFHRAANLAEREFTDHVYLSSATAAGRNALIDMFQAEPVLWLQGFASPALTWLLRGVTLLGYAPVYVGLILFLAFAVRFRSALYVRRAMVPARRARRRRGPRLRGGESRARLGAGNHDVGGPPARRIGGGGAHGGCDVRGRRVPQVAARARGRPACLISFCEARG